MPNRYGWALMRERRRPVKANAVTGTTQAKNFSHQPAISDQPSAVSRQLPGGQQLAVKLSADG